MARLLFAYNRVMSRVIRGKHIAFNRPLDTGIVPIFNPNLINYSSLGHVTIPCGSDVD